MNDEAKNFIIAWRNAYIENIQEYQKSLAVLKEKFDEESTRLNKEIKKYSILVYGLGEALGLEQRE